MITIVFDSVCIVSLPMGHCVQIGYLDHLLVSFTVPTEQLQLVAIVCLYMAGAFP